jgi:hypothetical protein
MLAVRGFITKRLATKAVAPVSAKTVAPAVEKIAVVEKQSLLKSSALAVGGGVVKTGAVVGTLGLVGAGAQQFKNSLFSGLNNLGGESLGSIGGIGAGLSDAITGASNDIMTGVLIVGGCIVVGVIYKIIKK